MRSLRLSSAGLAAALAAGGFTAVLAGPAYGASDRRCVHTTKVTHKTPYPLAELNPSSVWSISSGAGVTVAVIDTGVDAGNPQLRGAVRAGGDLLVTKPPKNKPAKKKATKKKAANGRHPGGRALSDCDGHGTRVAGIIAARPREGTGFEGIAPAATILSIRAVARHNPKSNATVLAEAIKKAVGEGADVINISATEKHRTGAVHAAVAEAVAHDVVVVAAAGNDAGGAPRSGKVYPAADPAVLAVGAVGPDGEPSGFSLRGSYVDVVAPGKNVVSTAPGTGQSSADGTSFATPFVSGTAALVRAAHPKLSAARVVARIEATADRPHPERRAGPALGWGEVDPYAAVTSTLTSSAIGRLLAASPAPRPARYVAPKVAPATAHRPVGTALITVGVAAAVISMLLWAGAVARRRRRTTPSGS